MQPASLEILLIRHWPLVGVARPVPTKTRDKDLPQAKVDENAESARPILR